MTLNHILPLGIFFVEQPESLRSAVRGPAHDNIVPLAEVGCKVTEGDGFQSWQPVLPKGPVSKLHELGSNVWTLAAADRAFYVYAIR